MFLMVKRYSHPAARSVMMQLAVTVKFAVHGVRNIPIAGRRLP